MSDIWRESAQALLNDFGHAARDSATLRHLLAETRVQEPEPRLNGYDALARLKIPRDYLYQEQDVRCCQRLDPSGELLGPGVRTDVLHGDERAFEHFLRLELRANALLAAAKDMLPHERLLRSLPCQWLWALHALGWAPPVGSPLRASRWQYDPASGAVLQTLTTGDPFTDAAHCDYFSQLVLPASVLGGEVDVFTASCDAIRVLMSICAPKAAAGDVSNWWTLDFATTVYVKQYENEGAILKRGTAKTRLRRAGQDRKIRTVGHGSRLRLEPASVALFILGEGNEVVARFRPDFSETLSG